MDKPRPSGSGRLCLPEHPTNRTGPKNTTRTLKVNPPPATTEKRDQNKADTHQSRKPGRVLHTHATKAKRKTNTTPPAQHAPARGFLPSRKQQTNNKQTTNKTRRKGKRRSKNKACSESTRPLARQQLGLTALGETKTSHDAKTAALG